MIVYSRCLLSDFLSFFTVIIYFTFFLSSSFLLFMIPSGRCIKYTRIKLGGVEALPPRGHISGASREMKGIVEEGRRIRVGGGGGGCRVSAAGFCWIL